MRFLLVFFLFLPCFSVLRAASLSLDNAKHRLYPGYSSSYLRLDRGEIVHGSEKEKLSLLEKFDLARQNTLGRGEGELLYPFLKDELYRKEAFYWEGFCDQWSGAATDTYIESLLLKLKGRDLVCGNISFKEWEIRELFSALYPASLDEDDSYDSYGMDSFPLDYNNKKSDDAYYSILDSIGYTHLPPHKLLEILEKAFSKEGAKRVRCNVDSRGEIWNQPVHEYETHFKKIEINSETFLETEIPAFSVVPEKQKDENSKLLATDLIKASFKNYKALSFFFEGSGTQIKENLNILEQIDFALMKLFSAGIFENTNPYFILKSYNLNNSVVAFPSFNESILEVLRKSGNIYEAIEKLNSLKGKIFKDSLKLGLKLKENFELYEGNVTLTYVEEVLYGDLYFYLNDGGEVLDEDEQNKYRNEGKMIHKYPYNYAQKKVPEGTVSYRFYIMKDKLTSKLYSRWKDLDKGNMTRPSSIAILPEYALRAKIQGPDYLNKLPLLIEEIKKDSSKHENNYPQILMAGLYDLLLLLECPKSFR